MNISDIIDECYKCEPYRKLERACLNGPVKYEYSCSEETQEALEEADPTGRALEAKCTNLAEVQAADAISEEALHKHVLVCTEHGCTLLREYRHELKVPGY